MTPAERALDALALVENVLDANETNWNYLLDTLDQDELLIGLVDLAKSLILSLANNTGQRWAEIVELQRYAYLLAGDTRAAS